MLNKMLPSLKKMKARANVAPTAYSRAKSWALVAFDVLLFMLLFSVMLTLATIFLSAVLGLSATEQMPADSVRMLIYEASVLCMALLAIGAMSFLRGLPLSMLGFSLRRCWSHWPVAFLLTACLYAVGFSVSLLWESVAVVAVSFHPLSLLTGLLSFLLVAVFEEVMLRGFVLGRMLDGGVNKYFALFLSSLLFSLMHYMNPGFSLLPFINILLAGVFLGASYIYTRNLCFPIALHWFWNWIQGSIFGYGVSGNSLEHTLLTLSIPEADLINGGSFGFEGSLLCTFLLMAGAGLIIGYYQRTQKRRNHLPDLAKKEKTEI